MRKTALMFASSRRRETGPSQVVDDKTTTEFLDRACAVTFTSIPVVLCSSSWLLKLRQVWDNARTLNLENCRLYLLSTIPQSFGFIRWMVFDFIFFCVTTHTLYISFNLVQAEDKSKRKSWKQNNYRHLRNNVARKQTSQDLSEMLQFSNGLRWLLLCFKARWSQEILTNLWRIT